MERERNECSFTIPLLPPSVNSLHNVFWSLRRIELKPEIRRWRSEAKAYVPRFMPTSTKAIIEVEVTLYYPLFTKVGELRSYDSHNAIKPLLDMIAEKQGWNDKQAKVGSWRSVDSKDEKVEVKLREIVSHERRNHT